jgi:hypothetical protein
MITQEANDLNVALISSARQQCSLSISMIIIFPVVLVHIVFFFFFFFFFFFLNVIVVFVFEVVINLLPSILCTQAITMYQRRHR